MNKNSINIDDPELARAMTYGEFTEEDEKTDSDCVRFGAFFLRDLDGDGYAEKIKGTCKELGGEDTLYFSVNVLSDGILKNGKIEIDGENIYFQTALVEDESIKGNYVSTNTREIALKDINVGTQKLIFGSVRSGDYSSAYTKAIAIGKDTTKYSSVNKIKFTGTHVATDGTETAIEKEILLPVDWYSTPNTEIPYVYAENENNKSQNYSNEEIFNESNQTVNLSFKIVTQETKNIQNLSKAYIEGEIPKFNGYDPLNIEITGSNVTFTYDTTTRKFSAQREAVLDNTGKIITEAYSGSYKTTRYTEFYVTATYPLEAYETAGIDTINLNVPVKAYYEGYNNPNEEFTNPVRSNIAEDIISVIYEFGGGDVIGFDVKVGKYVSKPYDAWVISKDKAIKTYQNNETSDEEDTYEVLWRVKRGADGNISNIKLKETDENYTDRFLTSDNQYIDMQEFVSNKGIYFSNAIGMFGENGWIRVYNDETDELIHEFTSSDWNNYTKETPYIYETAVKHIRIETSQANSNSMFMAYNIKLIDNKILTQNISEEQFENIRLVFSYMTAYTKHTENDEYIAVKNDLEKANYDTMKSIVSISNVTPSYYSTQETKENAQITISTKKLEYNTIEWKDGEFLLKFPKEILKLEINNISISNNNVTILGYSLDEGEDGYYLKILTENEDPETYDITINCNITPDPRKLSSTRIIELYSMNQICTSYNSESSDIYDLDDDENTDEIVGKNTASIQLVGPTSLITMEQASEYNDTQDILETSIAPQIAIIDKANEEKTAKVSASILNNYSGSISNIKLVGKIPFEGNTFQLTEKDLGSTYTTQMTGAIVIPEALREYATVYYSENEVVTNDLNDATNNWIPQDEITDYSNIKTYLIDLGEYVMSKGEEQICTYEIIIPKDLNYNEISYSTHAVYFNLETQEGKFADRTETNKLGFMIAKKYNLQIEKIKENTDILLKGAVYKITDEDGTESKIAITNKNGELTFKDLLVEKTYTVEEIKAPENYEKTEEKLKIKATVDEETGELTVNILEGEYTEKLKIENVSQATEQVTLENKPKIILNILKKSKEETPIEDVRFKITGKGFTTGRTLITNGTGTATLAALYENEIYTLEEVKAEGYYLSESIEFKIVKNSDNTYKLEYTDGTVNTDNIKSITFTENENYIPVLNLEINNEKIPTYNLEILKVAKDTNEPLSNTQFLLKNLETNEEKYFNTDENGLINIDGLYQYVEGKNILAEYELSEVAASEGYITDNTIYHFRVVKENDILKVESLDENSFEYVANEDKVQATLKNAPIFKLQKLDGETTQALPNTKFAIYKIDEDYNEYPAFDVNGNLVGETQVIDENEYQVITTDENGEISLNLPSGLYKVIEIEALENYEFSEEIEDRTYYFGIYETVQGSKEWIAESINDNDNDSNLYGYSNKLFNTGDGGYISVSNYNGVSQKIPSDKTVYDQDIEINTNGRAILIIKYSKNDKIEWIKIVDGELNDYYEDSAFSENNGEIALITYSTSDSLNLVTDENKNIIEFEDNSQYSSNNYAIIKINLNTNETYATQLFGNILLNYAGSPSISDFNIDGGIAISLLIDKSSPIVKNTVSGKAIDITSQSQDGMIIAFNTELKATWGMKLGSIGNDGPGGVKSTNDGGYIITTFYRRTRTIAAEDTADNTSIELTAKTTYNTGIIKFNSKGKVEWVYTINSNSITFDLVVTENNEYIIYGRADSNIIIPAEDTVKGEEIIYENSSTDANDDIYVLKLTQDAKVEWLLGIGAPGQDTAWYMDKYNDGEEKYIINLTKTSGEEIIIAAEKTYNNQEIVIPAESRSVSVAINNEGKVIFAVTTTTSYSENYFYRNGSLISTFYSSQNKIYQKEILPEVPELQEINVENYKKKYVIITNSGYGGTISGREYTPYYEQVTIHENSKKDIIVTPDEGFIIKSIMVNNEEIPFETDENGIAILNKFTDMTEDKYVYVRFVEKEYALTINKVDEENNPISDVQFKITKNFEDETPASNDNLGELCEENPLNEDEDEGETITYTFVKQEDGTLIPNNLGIENTTAEAYIPIDLTNYKDSYEIVTNVDGVLSSGDYGYLDIINEDGSYYGDAGYLSGTMESRDYRSINLEGGAKYYLVLSYYKNSTTTDDSLVINSINLNRSTLKGRAFTNGNGQAIITLLAGTWTIEELETVDGYILNEEKKEVELNDENNSATVEFVNKKEIIPTVIVHHYKENTTERVSEDEVLTGNIDENYTTAPKMDLEEYEVIVEKIPSNASGVYTEEVQEVIYYYKERGVTLVVHHYLEGTTQEISSEGYESKLPKGEEYTTESAKDLEEKYELIEVPANSAGILTENTVVNYYYRIKTFNVITRVEESGGNILGENESPYEIVKYGEDSIKEITATPEAGYEVSKITVNGEEIEFTENEDKSVTLSNFVNMTEDKEVVVTFERIPGTVIVHHYEYGTENSIVPDEEKNGLVGDIFATKPSEEIPEYYELSGSSETTSGTYTEETQEVIYYYKLKEYQYQVEYYYDGELDEEKTDILKAAYGSKINTYENKIIDGYELEDEENIPLTIAIDETQNIIKIYYIRKTDLSYTVNYLEKDTNKIIHDSKTVENQIFQSIITSSDEIIEIPGYNYDSVDKENLTISTGLNEINIYYTKKDTKVTVHYYEEGTTNEISEDIEIPGKVFDPYTTEEPTDIPSKYELVAVPENATGEMTEEEIVVIYYYRKKATQIIVHHYEEGTTNKLSENVIIDGRVDDPYTTEAATDVPIKYELVADPENKAGTMTEDVIEVTYYYRVKDAILNIRYLEKGTEKVLADPEQQTGKVDEQYITTEKPIEGYTLVEDSGNTTGLLTVEPITVTFYYLYNTKATVQYIDKNTGEILDERTEEGLEGDEFVTESQSFNNYILVEEPEEKTVNMTKEEIVLKYYYVHVSAGVIEKHIDKISGEILYNDIHEGNEGDPYDIKSKENDEGFEKYDLVEDELPENSTGEMTKEVIEVTYYYIYKTKVTAKYIDKAT